MVGALVAGYAAQYKSMRHVGVQIKYKPTFAFRLVVLNMQGAWIRKKANENILDVDPYDVCTTNIKGAVR